MIKNDDDNDCSFKSLLSSFFHTTFGKPRYQGTLYKRFSFSDFITTQLLSDIKKASCFLEKVIKIITIEIFRGNSKQFSQN